MKKTFIQKWCCARPLQFTCTDQTQTLTHLRWIRTINGGVLERCLCNGVKNVLIKNIEMSVSWRASKAPNCIERWDTRKLALQTVWEVWSMRSSRGPLDAVIFWPVDVKAHPREDTLTESPNFVTSLYFADSAYLPGHFAYITVPRQDVLHHIPPYLQLFI